MFDTTPLLETGRTAYSQFGQQVVPFVLDLSARYGNGWHRANRPDLASVERIAARRGLRMDDGQIRIDCVARRNVRPETLELRMMRVAASSTAQDSLSQ
jgi:hypothetical protein